MFRVIKTEGTARQGEFTCPHGVVQTPVFMNVGTQGAIKGALSAFDLKDIGCQIELSNTYHLHLRPGDDVVRQMGGLHKFMRWDGPMLTDSGGFQVFSLAGLRKIKEEGVYFNSHIDGRKIFMGPEESMQIQSNLGSTIAMAFDECPSSRADYEYIRNSVDRTTRWLERCKKEMARLKLDNAVETALTAAGAKNSKALRALLDAEKIKLDESGKLSGLSEQLEAIRKSDGYLFAEKGGEKPSFKGFQPGASGDVKPDGETDFSKMTYSEMTAYLAQNPGAKIE